MIHNRNFQKWMDGLVLSGPKPHLLGLVRSLIHYRGTPRTKYELQDLPQDSGRYLSGLCNLRSLTLSNTRVRRINEEEFRTCFSAFRETLTYISFDAPAVSFGGFVTLVDCFPKIRTLRIHSPVHEDHEDPIPPLSRPLRGKLHVRHSRHYGLVFFERFSKLDLEYEELIIGSCSPMSSTFLERALQISTGTVKFLRLIAECQLSCE